MIEQRLREFYERNLKEIRENKLRFKLIATCFAISILLFIFFREDSKAEERPKSNPVTIVSKEKKGKSVSKSEKKSNVSMKILGLEKATRNVEIVNPFLVDIEKPTIMETIVPNVQAVQVVPQSLPEPSSKVIETKNEVMLTLKGTAISGDKKMAIIQRGVADMDKKTLKSRMLTIGDEVDGHKITDIRKDSVTFDNGRSLYLQQEGQQK